MLALEDYPIEMENNETGRLKTESIQTGTIWKLPFKRKAGADESKYIIHIKLIKGRIDSVPVVKALVLKKIFVQKGFMSVPERQASDGMEERAILYRIFREISIEKAIVNYHKDPVPAGSEEENDEDDF